MFPVQGAPSIYRCHLGALDELENLLLNQNVKSVLIIHGQKSLEASKDFLPALSKVNVNFELYNGECSEAEINRITIVAKRLQADCVIGLGGGKVIDLAKAVGHNVNKDVVLIPTIASTCAAWTPLSVIYDEEGSFKTFTIFPRSNFAVLIEPRIISQSPVSYLRAGIGDTLAKWYEAKAVVHSLKVLPVPVQVALQTAKLAQQILLNEGNNALDALQKEELTESLIAIIEANIMLGGMVGGFGERYGRSAGAHSIHNALTHLPETHQFLHGEKVAYGILVQLALEKNWEEITYLVPFYKRIQLPTSLADLNLSINQEEALNLIAEKALDPTEFIHYMQETYQPKDIIKAIKKLEAISIK